MNQTTLEARAQQRAHTEHVHIFAVAGRSDCYITKSKSGPAERYHLVAGPDGIVGCSCCGFEYRQSCKHAEALKNRLAREAVLASRMGRQLQAVA
jgi:hypothetical protein